MGLNLYYKHTLEVCNEHNKDASLMMCAASQISTQCQVRTSCGGKYEDWWQHQILHSFLENC